MGVATRAELATQSSASPPASTAGAPTVPVPAPVSSTTAATARQPTYLQVVAPPADIPNLDPIKWAEPHIQRVYRPSVESLYRWRPGGAVEPLLAAEPWDVTRDRLVYTVQLRQDVTFHDGTRLDSTAVVEGFRAVLEPDNGSQWAPRLADSLAEVEASGPATVVFRMNRPFSPFETLLGLIPIVSAAQPYEPQLTHARSVAGTGPFQLSWQDEATFGYTRFPGYHGTTGSLDGFRLSFADQDEAAASLLSETADLALAVEPGWMGPARIPATESSVHYRAVANLDPTRITSSFAFRHALWRTIERDRIVDDILEGSGVPAYSAIAPGTVHATDQDRLRRWRDPAPIPEATSEALTVVTVDDPTLHRIAGVVQNALASLGFGSELVTIPGIDLARTLCLGEPGVFGDFDLLVLGSFAQPLNAFSPDYAYYGLRSGLVTNLAKVADPELDRLLDAAVSAPHQERPTLWRSVQEYDVASSLVEIPIVEGRYAESVSRLTGYTPSPLGSLDHLAQL